MRQPLLTHISRGERCENPYRLFPEKYAPDVSLFTDGKVEIMFKLRYEAGGKSRPTDEGARPLAFAIQLRTNKIL